MGEFVFEDRQFTDATRRGEAERVAQPLPKSVHFEPASGRIVVNFQNGSAFIVPARLLQGLEEASDNDLADVSLAGETGLHWERLDVDYTIDGLMRGLFGTAGFMDAARRGGLSRSDAKVAASRANGTRGGRPRKSKSALG